MAVVNISMIVVMCLVAAGHPGIVVDSLPLEEEITNIAMMKSVRAVS